MQYGAFDSVQSIGAKVLMHALRPTADLEQLRAFPLAPPATNDITPPLLARLHALLNAFVSVTYATNIYAPIRLFACLFLESRRIRLPTGF